MARRRKRRVIPEFRSEAEERQFWETHDTTDYIDWSRAKIGVFPNLKPSTKTISLRLPASLLAELKVLANKRDVPYQSLLKVFLAERIARERVRESGAMSNKPSQRTVRTRSRASRR